MYYFLEHVTIDFFSHLKNIGNVVKRSVYKRIALYKSYLFLLLLVVPLPVVLCNLSMLGTEHNVVRFMFAMDILH